MIINLYDNYSSDDRRIEFDYKKIIEIVSNGIKEDKEVSLILVDASEIHRMNKEYRGLDRPTDVISFEEDDEEDDTYLGDIFICIDKVYEQALAYGHSKEREFAFLLVHGILHLSGYDHIQKEDEIIMFAKQDEILNNLCLRRENNETK